jgi:hypothetical protein
MKFDKTEYDRLVDNIRAGRVNASVQVASFGGPSTHFHQRAITECQTRFLSDEHIEMVYATLVAWGMHRTGRGGAKMPVYSVFHDSIIGVSKTLQKYKNTNIENVSESDISRVIAELSDICFGANAIKGSTTNSKLVSASKILAHILPNLVPPMDRQYTVRFFNQRKPNSNLSLEEEQEFFEKTMRCLWEFYQESEILNLLQPLVQNGSVCSLPKLFDDLIIATF